MTGRSRSSSIFLGWKNFFWVGIKFSKRIDRFCAGDRVLIIHIGICMLETIFMAGWSRSAGMKYVFTSAIEGAEIGRSWCSDEREEIAALEQITNGRLKIRTHGTRIPRDVYIRLKHEICSWEHSTFIVERYMRLNINPFPLSKFTRYGPLPHRKYDRLW